MKKKLFIIIISLYSTYFYGQQFHNFIESQEYKATSIDSTLSRTYFFNPEKLKTNLYNYVLNSKGEKVLKYKVRAIDTFDGFNIETLDLSYLNNIEKVLKVNEYYTACCTNKYSNYYLINKIGEFKKLPILENIHCDGPEPEYRYIFPSQKFGKTGKILQAFTFLNENYEIDSIKVEKAYSWDGYSFKEDKINLK